MALVTARTTESAYRDENGDYLDPWAALYNAHEADDFDGQMIPAIEQVITERVAQALLRRGGCAGAQCAMVVRTAPEQDFSEFYMDDDDYVDCTCGHPNADHVAGACPFPGCGCGVLDESDNGTAPNRPGAS